MQVGDRVFVGEYGHGARPGKVIAVDPVYVTVKLDEQDCPRRCFPGGVFKTREEAEAYAKP